MLITFCAGDWLDGCDDRLTVPPTVLVEACYVIDRFLGPGTHTLTAWTQP
jgi:hypothetical protein